MNEITKAAKVEICDTYGYMQDGFETLLEYAQSIGKILCEQQAILDRDTEGVFRKWVEDELPFSRTTAWRWMRLHKEKEAIKGTKNIAEAIRRLAPVIDEPPKDPPAEEKKTDPTKKDETKPDPDTKTTEPPPENPAEPKKLKTTVGQDVPDDLIEIFERLGEIREPIAKLNGALKVIRDAVKDGDELYAYLTFTALESAVKNATRQLRHAMPYALCVYCGDRVVGSDIPSGCKACNGLGWIPEKSYVAASEEQKQ